jgi:hypothetical protein
MAAVCLSEMESHSVQGPSILYDNNALKNNVNVIFYSINNNTTAVHYAFNFWFDGDS